MPPFSAAARSVPQAAEALITNYDPKERERAQPMQMSLFGMCGSDGGEDGYEIVVLPAEHHGIMPFRLIIGRVTVEKGAVTVILPDQRLKVLILHHRVGKPAGCLPDGVKAFAHVKVLAAVTRINNLAQRYDGGCEFPEVLITNYDPKERERAQLRAWCYASFFCSSPLSSASS